MNVQIHSTPIVRAFYFSLALVLITSVAATDAAAKSWTEDWDGDGQADHYFHDRNDDGLPEVCQVDKNEDGIPEEQWQDEEPNGSADGTWDKKWTNYDSSGQPHAYKHDSDGDGHFETEWVDRNNNGMIEQGELTTMKWTEPGPSEPRPRDASAPDCSGDPECDEATLPEGSISWLEDQVPNGFPDHWFSDRDGDGVTDWAARDLDEDGLVEESFVDQDDDGIWDEHWTDENRDGRWDRYRKDTDSDGHFDRSWDDFNNDGQIQIDEVASMEPPEPIFPEPFSMAPLDFCDGGLPCPEFVRFLQDPSERADHDRGRLQLTMSSRGLLGFADDELGDGIGLQYPSDISAKNHLYVGSLWVSNGPSYVANRDYVADPNREWVTETLPEGHPTKRYDGLPDQEIIVAGATDEEAPDAFGAYIRQESWAFDSGSSDDDFVIIRYFIHNRSGESQDGLYTGLFLDLDIDETAADDEGATDPDRNMAYLTDGSETFVGARILEGEASPPTSNLTLIPNQTYIYPENYMLDTDKFSFLSAEDPSFVLPLSPAPDDYSLLLAIGPLSLAPAESMEVVFAIVGGESLSDLQENADAAQELFMPVADVQTDMLGFEERNLVRSSPNPFVETTEVRYEMTQPGDVNLSVFDAQGRRVRKLTRGVRDAGQHVIEWNGRSDSGRKVESGVYFLKLELGTETRSRRVTVLR